MPVGSFSTSEMNGKEHYWEWREDSPDDLRRIQFTPETDQSSSATSDLASATKRLSAAGSERRQRPSAELGASGRTSGGGSGLVKAWDMNDRRDAIWSFLKKEKAREQRPAAIKFSDVVIDEYMAKVRS